MSLKKQSISYHLQKEKLSGKENRKSVRTLLIKDLQVKVSFQGRLSQSTKLHAIIAVRFISSKVLLTSFGPKNIERAKKKTSN